MVYKELYDFSSSFWIQADDNQERLIVAAYCAWHGASREITLVTADLERIQKHSQDDIVKLDAALMLETRVFASDMIAARISHLKKKCDLIDHYFIQ